MENNRDSAGFEIFHLNSIKPLPNNLALAYPMFNPIYLLVSLKTADVLAVLDKSTGRVK